MEIVIDSSVLVGIISSRDKWHQQATTLWETIKTEGHTSLYLDCVVSETVSVTTRRLREQNFASEIDGLLNRLETYVTPTTITWILPDVPRLYPDIIGLMKNTHGELNFHDALIALVCRERAIPTIASFDADFDRLSWLRRLSHPTDLTLS